MLVMMLIFQPVPLFARSSSDINQEIEKKEGELSAKEQEIEDLNNQIAYYEDQIENSLEGIPAIEAEIEKITLEIERNEKELESLQEKKELILLEKEYFSLIRNDQVSSAYKTWKSSDALSEFLFENGGSSYKDQQYRGFIYRESSRELESTVSDLEKLEKELTDLEAYLNALIEDNKTLATELENKRAEVIAFQNSIAYSEFSAGQLQEEVSQLNSQLGQLSGEQQQAIQNEQNQLNNNGSNISISGCEADTPGNAFYFCGAGRDSRQGHGVGMSQWGAHGMALSGFSANEIIQFYFVGVSISGGYGSQNISVDGYGTMNIETYVAGMGAFGSDLGEVPAKACGTAAQANANPSKYVVDNPNSSFDCWPEEAIKAQAIAYRTYALNYANRVGSICTTTVCQYYNGKNHAAWAASETAGQVATSGGAIIEALYSSDNSQGAGTANNETIWQNLDGTGYPVSYLRAANDSAWATTTSWTYWSYSTNTYTGADIDAMLSYVVSSSPFGASLKNYASNIKNSVGSVTALNFERDPSGRVSRVVITGTSGNAVIGGSWFKTMWNAWVDDTGVYNEQRLASGEGQIPDFIYSLSFYAK